jgi:hypothetical protein
MFSLPIWSVQNLLSHRKLDNSTNAADSMCPPFERDGLFVHNVACVVQ